MGILPWYWRSLSLEGRTGSQVFQALFHHPKRIGTLLESAAPHSNLKLPLARYSLCGGTPRLIQGKPRIWTPAVGEIQPFLCQLLPGVDSGMETNSPQENLPFTGGWLGWLGYDTAWEIEKLPYLKPDTLPFPVAYWYEPDSFAILDHHEQILWLAATEKQELDELQNKLETTPSKALEQSKSLLSCLPACPSFVTSQVDYEQAVRQAQKYIYSGDIFQANLSLRFHTSTTANSWLIYQALQTINPSPFASYWQTPWGAMMSCSPERLVTLQGTQAETRPIAGTRARGANQEMEEKLAEELITNVKERAEHIMLVDLGRNDLGRVCEWGSVKVDELLTIERYSHVMHLVSNITGTLGSHYNAVDLIRALFPGGTITGCPKVRCMEIIEELEPVRRNLFYGSCGYLDWRGNLDLNILIRTLLYTSTPQGARVWGQVGAGIVADSDPEREWFESLQKAQAQLAALKLVEGDLGR